jgi:hypothetical protein
MALTFAVGAGFVTAKNELDTHQLITAAIVVQRRLGG